MTHAYKEETVQRFNYLIRCNLQIDANLRGGRQKAIYTLTCTFVHTYTHYFPPRDKWFYLTLQEMKYTTSGTWKKYDAKALALNKRSAAN